MVRRRRITVQSTDIHTRIRSHTGTQQYGRLAEIAIHEAKGSTGAHGCVCAVHSIGGVAVALAATPQMDSM